MTWETVMESLQGVMSSGDYDLWIQPIRCSHLDTQVLRLVGPDQYFCSWVNDRYLPLIKDHVRKSGHGDLIVTISVARAVEKPRPSQLQLPGVPAGCSRFRSLHPRYTFEQFATGDSNLLARSVCEAIAQRNTAYGNCLFLNSSTGLGKTHLTQAVAHNILTDSPTTRLQYLTAQQFSADMVKQIQARSMDKFAKKYMDDCDVLLLEDVHTLKGKAKTQEELNNILDYLLKADKRVIFTSVAKPHSIEGLDRDVLSRMSAGFVACIESPDYQTRSNIIRQKANNYNLLLTSEHLDLLARSLHSDVRRLESAIVGLKARTDLLGVQVSTDMIHQVLQETVGETSLSMIDGQAILDLICKQYQVSIQDLKSKSRKQPISIPRQIAMYLTRKHTDLSLADIGSFYNRDHSTVLYAIKTVTRTISNKPAIRKQIQLLDHKLRP